MTSNLLFVLMGFLAFPVIFGIFTISKRLYFNVKYMISSNKQRKDMEKQKCKNAHKWISYKTTEGSKFICENCGYVPHIDSFASKKTVEMVKKSSRMESSYDSFKEKRFNEVSKEFGISRENLDSLLDKIYSTNFDWSKEFKNE